MRDAAKRDDFLKVPGNRRDRVIEDWRSSSSGGIVSCLLSISHCSGESILIDDDAYEAADERAMCEMASERVASSAAAKRSPHRMIVYRATVQVPRVWRERVSGVYCIVSSPLPFKCYRAVALVRR